ncbi:MAG: ABC transporter ATP-binding protein [Paracoccaceae bacterium]
MPSAEPIIELKNITKDFALGGMFFNKTLLRAISGVSLKLHTGRALSLVGESGSGKSTIARLIARVYALTEGEITFHNRPIAAMKRQELAEYRSDVQMIFQDPFGSLNPVHSIGYHLVRPLTLHNRGLSREDVKQKAYEMLEQVGLSPAADFIDRKPHELSGGQRQRVAIARALCANPKVLLADEPTSMLDVSVRLGILNLLADLKDKHGLSTLYITHDIATARYFSEDIAVMYAGHLVESGPSEAITSTPRHPYTQLLIRSVPNPAREDDPTSQRRATDIPLWTPKSIGCPFVSRCPLATDICRQTMPKETPIAAGHNVRCHHV